MKKRFVLTLAVICLIISGCSSTDSKESESVKKTVTNSIGMEFVFIPSGSFAMGADKSEEAAQKHEFPRHNVTIGKGFYLGKYEVTQEQWLKLMRTNPSKYKGDTKPVEQVSWYDAQIFISNLNALEKTTKYRLPTEAEWEYAARATSSAKYPFDESELGEYAWYYTDKTKDYQTQQVGQKSPNKWGLHDIYGNVWEWTADWYDAEYYAKSPTKDPNNYIVDKNNVIRGGSWINSADFLRSATRHYQLTTYKGDDVGFRVLMAIDAEEKK